MNRNRNASPSRNAPQAAVPHNQNMTHQEQLDQWVAGKSVHNPTRNECCPDFSCCQPHLKADAPTRRKFRDANQETRNHMLAEFLGALVADRAPRKRIRIIR